jgi:hypothetical protein
MTHSHTHQGQSLVHDHDGGDKPHGYFQHSEDVGLPEPSSPVDQHVDLPPYHPLQVFYHLAGIDEQHSVDFQQAKHCVSRLRRRVAIAEGLALSDIEGNDWDDYDDQAELPGEVLRDGLS